MYWRGYPNGWRKWCSRYGRNHRIFITMRTNMTRTLFSLPILAPIISVPAIAQTVAPHYPAPYTCTRNLYVSTSGADGGGCGTSQANACASIQGANNNIALQGGDCVHVAAGTY